MTKRKKAAKRVPEADTAVEIGGRSYRLHGDEPQLWRHLAAGVDRELREVAGPKGRVDDFKVAVLAALNISAGHEEERRDWLSRARRLRGRARSLSDRLERLAARAGGSSGQSG